MSEELSTPPPARQIALQRIYLKDASVEVPLAPQVFTRQWNPQLDVQVGTATTPLGDGVHQVMLTVTVTAKLGEETGFLVEVHQGGIFQLIGITASEDIQAILAGYCPGVIFPFAREAVADLIQRSGFPPVLLQPINFEALYMEHLARAREQAVAAGNNAGATVQ
ncbi:protein-export chaperone SecB [Nevskia soli]|uniref:protein-export chaperone SecB n=1 Tax=Nevskia soli TaxID=418856 RepID=UPI0004A74F17|nr:protein-export chaperone SecB [Nevskia soli]